MLVVGKEGVGDPYLLGEVSGQRHAVRMVTGEGQPLILPVLIKIDRYGVILQDKRVARHIIQPPEEQLAELLGARPSRNEVNSSPCCSCIFTLSYRQRALERLEGLPAII